MRVSHFACGCVLIAIGGLSACAADDGGGPMAAPTGSIRSGKCAELKAEAARLEARGVQYRADRAGRGEIKLSPREQADVDRYNAILNQYLGGKCHV